MPTLAEKGYTSCEHPDWINTTHFPTLTQDDLCRSHVAGPDLSGEYYNQIDLPRNNLPLPTLRICRFCGATNDGSGWTKGSIYADILDEYGERLR